MPQETQISRRTLRQIRREHEAAIHGHKHAVVKRYAALFGVTASTIYARLRRLQSS